MRSHVGSHGGTVVVSTPIWKSRITKFAAGLVFICLLSSPAFALDQTYGNEWRCTDWLEARDKVNNWIHGTSRHPPGEKIPTDDVVPSAWLIGFLEGYNWGCMQGDIAAGLDTKAVFERVDRICRSTQQIYLWDAVRKLIKQLRPESVEGLCLH
jgi:hypothetical protein